MPFEYDPSQAGADDDALLKSMERTDSDRQATENAPPQGYFPSQRQDITSNNNGNTNNSAVPGTTTSGATSGATTGGTTATATADDNNAGDGNARRVDSESVTHDRLVREQTEADMERAYLSMRLGDHKSYN